MTEGQIQSKEDERKEEVRETRRMSERERVRESRQVRVRVRGPTSVKQSASEHQSENEGVSWNGARLSCSLQQVLQQCGLWIIDFN